MEEELGHCDGNIYKTTGDDLDMIENSDLALKIKTQLEDYLTQLNYKSALVNIDDISIKTSRELFEKHELHPDKHHFSDLRGYFIYDECLIVKQLSEGVANRVAGLLEPLLVNKELSRFEVIIRHSSVIDMRTTHDILQATLYYEVKPYHTKYI